MSVLIKYVDEQLTYKKKLNSPKYTKNTYLFIYNVQFFLKQNIEIDRIEKKHLFP